jgi:hypothetical protein
MQEKQKVTLYIPQGLHKQLKVKAAVEMETMSAMVEKAISFYLRHPEVIEETEASDYGRTYQVHICPECEAAMVMRDGQMVSLKDQPSVITEDFPVQVPSEQEELVACG